jgi:hypothetical protein
VEDDKASYLMSRLKVMNGELIGQVPWHVSLSLVGHRRILLAKWMARKRLVFPSGVDIQERSTQVAPLDSLATTITKLKKLGNFLA